MTNTAAPATKIRAASWTRATKVTWDIEYNGYTMSARKINSQWNLFVWNEMSEDWADVNYAGEDHTESALRPFWNAVTAFLPTSEFATPNPLRGYTVATDEEITAAVASINAEHEADAAIQLAEAEGAVTAVLDEIDADNECPKCHVTGTAKCVTKSGKVVKENGGRHAVRPVN